MIHKQLTGNISTGTTDGTLTDQTGTTVAAVTGRRWRVFAAKFSPAGTATPVTFNSKGLGAGTAISATFNAQANGEGDLPFNPNGWFDTNAGEALTVTTGAGSTVGIQVEAGLIY